MIEILVRQSFEIPQTLPALVLLHNNWNDWWEYETQYSLSHYDTEGVRRHVGFVKIATEGQQSKQPELPETIPDGYFGAFSVGQDVEYYENLRNLGEEIADDVFMRLGDIAYDAKLRRRVAELQVTRRSLLRSVPIETVRGQFWRIAHGGARLTDYHFRFRRKESKNRGPLEITFQVIPESRPPTNIHVLIGRNGAGKSTLLGDILNTFEQRESMGVRFTCLIAVSFSAFDSFGRRQAGLPDGPRKVYSIGLKKEMRDPWDPGESKSDKELGEELKESLLECWSQPRRSRLLRAIEVLENDPIFAESEFSTALKDPNTQVADLANKYWRLSSGHKIVLLTMVRLVETVEEKSLVLIDEPEAHLHPPLLSAYMRALSDLLVDRNGLAIIATHSPVVLQEVPRSCVWKIARSGNTTQAGRPEIETFGENVGTLTHEVFGLEVEGTGFHGVLRDISLDVGSYEEGLARLDSQLGQEGRAILRALLTVRRLRGVS